MIVRSLLLLGVVVSVSCKASSPSLEPDTDEDARALLEQVRAEDYRQWPQPPRPDDAPTGPLQARGPHGAFIQIFLSPQLEAARTAEQTLQAWPAGSLVVAEGFDDPEGEPTVLPTLIMVGRRDEDAWMLAQYLADGEVLVAGRPAACVACHGGGDDMLLSIDLPEVDG